MRYLFSLCVCICFLSAPAVAMERKVPDSSGEVRLSFAPVVDSVAPSVVNIYATRRVKTRRRVPLIFNDPFFRHLFGGLTLGLNSHRLQNSLGAGGIVRPSGGGVTNNHVIEGAEEIRVVLQDRREFSATVVGRDPHTDLAVLRLKEVDKDLPYLEMGRRNTVDVGDLVLAIGNPFGIGQTVTSGIVSAIARTNVGKERYRFFIQTDAAINPGNSGGALVTLDGRLAGINTIILSRGGGSNGIGFATPMEMVRTVVESILTEGRVVRPWFGAGGQTVTPDLAETLGLERPAGVLVTHVAQNSPAARAGIKTGDIILSFDGRAVPDVQALRYRVALVPAGSEVPVRIYREGQEETLRVIMESPPETPPRNVTTLYGLSPLAGARVANINPALSEEIGLQPGQDGVVVLEVKEGQLADRLGLKRGDRILKIHDRAMERVKDLRETEKTRAWRIGVARGDQTMISKVQ